MITVERMHSLKLFLKRSWLYPIYDRYFRKACDKFRRAGSDRPLPSYSQCGEDLIMNFLCQSLQIMSPRYLDVGANHPVRGSNSYFFYRRGCSGVLVEPDPSLHAQIIRKRKRDLCLNVGIGPTDSVEADFYEMTDSALNTFSRDEAMRTASYGSKKIRRVLRIPLRSINSLLEQHFPQPPDILSLDIEGLDFAVLQSLDFDRHRPKIVCVETLTYSESNSGRKLSDIPALMEKQRYRIYADTHLNTIFVDASLLPG
jgi:FkbM family methyltransferase